MVAGAGRPLLVSMPVCVSDSSRCFRYIDILCVSDVLTFLRLFSITVHYCVDQLRHYVSNILSELHPVLWIYPALWTPSSRLICIISIQNLIHQP